MIVHTSANVYSGAGGFLRVWLPGRGRGPGSVSLSFDFSPSRVPHSTKEKRNEFFGVFVGIFLTAPTLNTKLQSISYRNMMPRRDATAWTCYIATSALKVKIKPVYCKESKTCLTTAISRLQPHPHRSRAVTAYLLFLMPFHLGDKPPTTTI